MVAEFADRTAAEPDCLGGSHTRRQRNRGLADRVEKQVEMIVGNGLSRNAAT
jgi:hypothetical protein